MSSAPAIRLASTTTPMTRLPSRLCFVLTHREDVKRRRGVRLEVVVDADPQQPATVGQLGSPSQAFLLLRKVRAGKAVACIEQVDVGRLLHWPHFLGQLLRRQGLNAADVAGAGDID